MKQQSENDRIRLEQRVLIPLNAFLFRFEVSMCDFHEITQRVGDVAQSIMERGEWPVEISPRTVRQQSSQRTSVTNLVQRTIVVCRRFPNGSTMSLEIEEHNGLMRMIVFGNSRDFAESIIGIAKKVYHCSSVTLDERNGYSAQWHHTI